MSALMKMPLRTLALTGLLAMAGCAGIPVATDYDPEYHFVDIERVAWVPETESKPPAEVDPLVHNDLVQRRIRRAVEEELRDRGYTVVTDAAEADVLVAAHIGTKEKIEIDRWHEWYGYYPCWSCRGPRYGLYNDVWVDEYTQGTLMIDLIDAESRKLVWRGMVERRLPSYGSPGERTDYYNETVRATLSHFPPGRSDND